MPRKPVLPKLLIQTLKTHHLVSALELQEILSNKGKNFNKTSVYRALEKLIDEGVVCKQQFDETEAVYELRSDHHDHAICLKCQKVEEIPCLVSVSQKKISNFQVDHHHMNVYGLCSICMKK